MLQINATQLDKMYKALFIFLGTNWVRQFVVIFTICTINILCELPVTSSSVCAERNKF